MGPERAWLEKNLCVGNFGCRCDSQWWDLTQPPKSRKMFLNQQILKTHYETYRGLGWWTLGWRKPRSLARLLFDVWITGGLEVFTACILLGVFLPTFMILWPRRRFPFSCRHIIHDRIHTLELTVSMLFFARNIAKYKIPCYDVR